MKTFLRPLSPAKVRFTQVPSSSPYKAKPIKISCIPVGPFPIGHSAISPQASPQNSQPMEMASERTSPRLSNHCPGSLNSVSPTTVSRSLPSRPLPCSSLVGSRRCPAPPSQFGANVPLHSFLVLVRQPALSLIERHQTQPYGQRVPLVLRFRGAPRPTWTRESSQSDGGEVVLGH